MNQLDQSLDTSADGRAPLKETWSLRQGWVTLGIVVFVSALFAFAVMPHLGDQGSGLEGVDAPDVALPVLHPGHLGNLQQGDRVRLSNLKGKVVVLDFWASWCQPCRAQMPILERVAERRQQDPVVFLGVNTAESRAAAKRFLGARGLFYPTVFDERQQTKKGYGVDGLPTLVVIDKNGTIAAVRRKVVTDRELERLLLQALGR